MNDAWGYSNDDDQDNLPSDGPKALRDAYKALKQQNEDLNQKLTSFLEGQKKQQLETVFTSLGVPEAVKLYQGEPDPEKAKAWVDTMRGVFGSGNVQGDPTPAPPSQPAITNDQQAQYEAMVQAGSTGTPMGNFDAAASAVNSATSIQDLINASMQSQHLR
jgi:hypothetical protein